MRKFLLLLFILSFSYTKASHGGGGEISWECNSNGKYIFHLTVYVRCIAPAWGSTSQPYPSPSLQISGNPLPRGINNNSISSITMVLDSSSLLESNMLTPFCDTSNSLRYSCFTNGNDPGYYRFEYTSSPIQFLGTAPLSGWMFAYSPNLIGRSYLNLQQGSYILLKAFMYTHNGQYCNDNSPVYAQRPEFLFFKNEHYKYPEKAFDFDNDSLVYSFDSSFNRMNKAVPFQIGFNLSSQLPGLNSNPNNIPMSINPNSGEISFKVFNAPSYYNYGINRRVDAYRNGRLISTNYRELPFMFSDSNSNQKPIVSPPFYKGGTTFSFKDTITAGSQISINLNVIDTNRINGNLQEIRVQVVSDAIAKDYTFNGVCTNPKDTNCAYIPTANAAFNAQRNGYEIRRTALYNGQIRWQTDCSDLSQSRGAKTHYFVVRAQDDMCPIPGLAYETIEVTVIPPTSNPCPIITTIEDKIEWKEKIALYPNPTNGQFTIDSKVGENLNYRIYNLQGQLVQKGALINTTTQIQLQGEKGLYFITITNQKGEQANFKVVMQ